MRLYAVLPCPHWPPQAYWLATFAQWMTLVMHDPIKASSILVLSTSDKHLASSGSLGPHRISSCKTTNNSFLFHGHMQLPERTDKLYESCFGCAVITPKGVNSPEAINRTDVVAFNCFNLVPPSNRHVNRFTLG